MKDYSSTKSKKSKRNSKKEKPSMIEVMGTMMLAKSMGVGGDEGKSMLLNALNGGGNESESSEDSIYEDGLK